MSESSENSSTSLPVTNPVTVSAPAKLSKRKQQAEKFRKAIKKGEKFVKEKLPDDVFDQNKQSQEILKKEKAQKLKEAKELKAKRKRETEEERDNDATQKAATDTKRAKQESKVNTKIKGSRFIVFVGNLPYSVSQGALEEHLAACKPDVIRIPTDKATGKVKGFAFAEFIGTDASKRLKACLRLHHTDFSGRRINIELTAGGGGKSEVRKQRLQEKNEKLQEERDQLKAVQTVKERERYAKSGHGEGGGNGPGFVHPSRLAALQ